MKDGVEKFIKSTVWVAIIFFGLRCGVSWKSIVENTMLKGRYYTDRKTNGDIELIVKE